VTVNTLKANYAVNGTLNRAYIDRENVVERYVQRKLDSDATAEFEIYMLDHPEIAEAVEYARGMQAGMNAAHSEFFLAATPSTGRSKSAWTAYRYAVAAGVLLACMTLVTAFYYRRTQLLDSELVAARGPAVVSAEVWLEPMRGSAALIIEKQRDEAVVLRAVIDELAEAPFRIDVYGAHGESVWTLTDVLPDAEPSVAVFARDLPYGIYKLVVTSEADGEIAADYALELIPRSIPE